MHLLEIKIKNIVRNFVVLRPKRTKVTNMDWEYEKVNTYDFLTCVTIWSACLAWDKTWLVRKVGVMSRTGSLTNPPPI